MKGEHQDGMDCTQFETLLSEALDGSLSEPVLAGFKAHAAACADCGPMLAAARAGMNWLKSLPEVEPPRNLVRNILIATSGAEAVVPARKAASTSPWQQRLRGWAQPLAPVFSVLAQPRLALSLAMAFFSLTVLLNVAGLHLSGLRASDLRPSAIEGNLTRAYNEATARAVKYYENIRLVYEIESRVREFQNAAREEDRQQRKQEPEKRQDRKYRDNNRSYDPSGSPGRKQEHYSRRNEPQVQAGNSLDRPWNALTNRRSA
jgi:hypothetical protein